MRFDIDPTDIARAALDDEDATLTVRRRAAAVRTLAETGGPNDRARVEDHLDHSSPRVRAAAAALDGACSTLDRVRAVYDALETASAREVLLRQRPLLPLWDRAELLLDAAKDPDEDLRIVAP